MQSRMGITSWAAKTLAALALLAALAVLVLAPAQAGAQAPDVDRGGRYHGLQLRGGPDSTGARFVMSLQQSGNTLSGSILQGEGRDAIDRITGAIVGNNVVLVRHSTPPEFWMGTLDGQAGEGRWVTAREHGTWSMRRVATETALRLDFSVEPSSIPAGELTERLTYRMVIHNSGRVTAEDVTISIDEFPAFFRLREVITERSTTDAEVLLVDGDPDLHLGLRALQPGETVVVRAIGAASPERSGEATTIAVAAAANAERQAARTTLQVHATALELRSHFIPTRFVEESDRRVVYRIHLAGQALSTDAVVVQSDVSRLLERTSVTVRGAEVRGSLETGLEIVPLGDGRAVEVIVTGSASHLGAGRYAATAVATVGDRQLTSQAEFIVVPGRDARGDDARNPRATDTAEPRATDAAIEVDAAAEAQAAN